MTNNDVLELFHKKKPKTLNAITRLGFQLELIGIGLYRKVYRITDTDYVVKIPVDKDGIEHSVNEYNACCEINGNFKYRTLWKYMPDFSYYDEVRGILIMPYYYPVDTGTKQARHRGAALSAVMYDLFKLVWKKGDVRSIDIHDGNVGLTKLGEPVMIDMGYFYGSPDENDKTRKGS